MKKTHILALIVFFSLLFGIGKGLYLLSERIVPPYQKGYGRDVEYFLDHECDFDAVTVGSSLNRAIDFASLGLKGQNLWVPGSDFFETSYFLRCVLPELKCEKVIFLPLSPIYVYNDNLVMESVKGRPIIYYITPSWRSFKPIQNDYDLLIQGKLAPLLRPDHWQAVFVRLYRRGWDAFEKVEGNPGRRVKPRSGTYRPAVKKSAAFSPRGMQHAKLLQSDKSGSRMSKAKRRKYEQLKGIRTNFYDELEGLLTFVKKYERFRIILYVPPHVDLYLEAIKRRNAQEIDAFDAKMKQLSQKYGIEFYDYYEDPEFIHNYTYFYNENHLNITGARLFSRKLRAAMDSHGG